MNLREQIEKHTTTTNNILSCEEHQKWYIQKDDVLRELDSSLARVKERICQNIDIEEGTNTEITIREVLEVLEEELR